MKEVLDERGAGLKRCWMKEVLDERGAGLKRCWIKEGAG